MTLITPTEIQMEEYLLQGENRAKIEGKLLSLLFNGFSDVTLDYDEYNFVSLIESTCSITEYTHLIKADSHTGYSELTNEAKKYFHAMIALNALTAQGLTDKTMCVLGDTHSSDNLVNFSDDLCNTVGADIAWIARGLTDSSKKQSFSYNLTQSPYPNDLQSFQLKYIRYTLTRRSFKIFGAYRPRKTI